MSTEAPACPECGEDLQLVQVDNIESKGIHPGDMDERAGHVIPEMRWHCDACGYEALPEKHRAASGDE